MLDQYRAAGADTEADAQNAATTADSYENLMAAVEQYESESYTEDVIADTMVLINRDTLGASGRRNMMNLQRQFSRRRVRPSMRQE